MKAYLAKPGLKYLLLTLDSENEAEAQILMEMAATIPILHLAAKGSTIEGVVRIQFVTGEVKLSLKDDIENLISYASNNDQMDDDDFENLSQIKARMKGLGLCED